MQRTLLATAFLLAGAGMAAAQTPAAAAGYSANDIVVRVAFAGIVPLTPSSHIDAIGGNVGVTSGITPEVDLSYFFTDHISLQAIATATRHEITANDTKLTPVLGSRIDLASTYVLPPAVVAAWHFMPKAALDPYAGVGLDVLWPFDTQENKATLGGVQVVQKVGLSTAVGAVFNAGLDYNVGGPWFVNVDYKQVINRIDARIHTALGLVKANVDLDPAVFSVGIAYRF